MQGIKGNIVMMLFGRLFRGLGLAFLLGMIGSTTIIIIGLLLQMHSLIGAILVVIGLAMKLVLWTLLARAIIQGG